MPIAYKTRADGWPLCPRCGEDELRSALNWKWNGQTERPPMRAWLDAGLTCYKCSWSNIDPITLKVGPIVAYRQAYRLGELPKFVMMFAEGAGAYIDTLAGRYILKPGDYIWYDADWTALDVERQRADVPR